MVKTNKQTKKSLIFVLHHHYNQMFFVFGFDWLLVFSWGLFYFIQVLFLFLFWRGRREGNTDGSPSADEQKVSL